MATTRIILILAELAESERLYVEAPENDKIENPRWTPVYRGGGSNRRSLERTVWTDVGAFAWNVASRFWKYVAGNYAVTAKVQLLPVNDLLYRLNDKHKERLANQMQEIMREHSVVDLNVLADQIQEDSSLVRKIILKYLVEYLTDEMSLPVRIPTADDSLQDPSDS